MWRKRRLTKKERERRKVERAAARAASRAAYAQSRSFINRLQRGTDPDVFVTVSMPRTDGAADWGTAAKFVHQYCMFDTSLKVMPGPLSDQSRGFDVRAHVEPPDVVRVPEGTSIFVGDLVRFDRNGLDRRITSVRAVAGEFKRRFPYLDGCGQPHEGSMTGLPHLELRWVVGADGADEVLSRTPMAKVLFVSANTIASEPLDLEEELRLVELAIEGARRREKIVFRVGPAVRPDDLVRLTSRERPTVLHFSGHARRNGIMMRDDAGGSLEVGGAALQQFLAGRGVRLLVLNACYTDAHAEAALSEVDAVVGTTAAVDDEAARRFSVAFYRSLADGSAIRSALKDGMDAVALHGLNSPFRAAGKLDVRIVQR